MNDENPPRPLTPAEEDSLRWRLGIQEMESQDELLDKQLNTACFGCFLLMAALIIGIVLLLKSCNNKPSSSPTKGINSIRKEAKPNGHDTNVP
jgi:hypothetical protein